MTKIEKELEEIKWIWKKFSIEWYLNVFKMSLKEISFSPLWNEISLHENTEIWWSINIFRNFKKLNIKTSDFSYANIVKLIEKNLFLLEIWDKDEDNQVFSISDKEYDDSKKFSLSKIDWDFLMKQWLKVKDFKLEEGLSIEWFSYSLSEQESYFLNSTWSYKVQKWNSCNYSYALLYNSPTFSDFWYATKYSNINEDVWDDFLRDVSVKLLEKINPTKSTLKSWKHNITIRNDVIIDFLDMLMQWCKGEIIRQNQSFFSKDDIWKIVMSKNISIKSNPKYLDSTFNSLFDSEWISSKELMIIENWVLKNIFLDSKNARKFWLNPSWNPTYSNLEIIWERSKDYLDKSCFLFTNFLWLHMTDMTTWKFAIEWDWFEINNWKIWNFVRNVWFSSNIKDLFLNIEALWNDDYTYANIFSPSITFKDQMLIF